MEHYTLRDPIDEDAKKELEAYSEFLQDLLWHRDIKNSMDAEEFLNPNYEKHTHDPFLMKNMERAVKRVLSAVKKNERIAIYSDYDCDGIPGATLLHDFFAKIEYENFTNYIPHRHEEGYGLNNNAIEKLYSDEVKLIITVDVGITCVEEVDYANSKKIDVIITDHHLPGPKLPNAFTILNPKQDGEEYPFKDLCGSGVAFKLVQALIAKGGFNLKEGWEKWLLDVAGIATIADMVPLVGENRTIAHYGLLVLRKSPRPGLMKLLRKLRMKQSELSEDDIGFMIAPRINAASRMDRPDDAFNLLRTRDEVEAGMLSDHLDKINNERKGVVAAMVKDIKKRIEKIGDGLGSVIVMGNPDWKPALLGLVANSLMDTYKRPAFLWGREGGESEGVLKGSCRSDGSVNLVLMMEEAGETLLGFGGHKHAGGFSVTNENVHHLQEVLNTAYEKTRLECGAESLIVDKKLWLDDVNWQNYKHVKALAPYGVGNPKPTFLFEDVVPFSLKQFGKVKNHLEITFKNGDKNVIAIGFFANSESYTKKVEEGKQISLIASMEKSTFRNFPELRLRIIDIC
ncbi:MAG: single-stranded-DNA-specific exonuclease RecJ [Parcubacteria group bacterium]|nr:single-stranded-DNA-specific exonuclease RecJ [Parcubacteria group bacterium]